MASSGRGPGLVGFGGEGVGEEGVFWQRAARGEVGLAESTMMGAPQA
jgi:hypothetical protein